MDGEPPPFHGSILAEEESSPYTNGLELDENDEFGDMALPNHLPHELMSPIPGAKIQNVSPKASDYSIPEYASSTLSDSTEITVKLGIPCNGHVDTPSLSGISELPTLESEMKQCSIAPSPVIFVVNDSMAPEKMREFVETEATSLRDNINVTDDPPHFVDGLPSDLTQPDISTNEDISIEVGQNGPSATVKDTSPVSTREPSIVNTLKLNRSGTPNDESLVVSPSIEDIDNDDEFGDFADYSMAPTSDLEAAGDATSVIVESCQESVPLEKKENESEISAIEDPECEWNAFGSAAPESSHATGDWASFQASTEASTSNSNNDDWGDFDAAPAPLTRQASNVRASINDDDWNDADFASAPPVPPPVAVNQPEIILPTLEDLGKESLPFQFENHEDFENDIDAFAITDVFDQENMEGLCGTVDKSSADLWMALRIVEDAKALKHSWQDSEMNNRVLSLLNIDPNYVGRVGLPVISTDSVLKPTPLRDTNKCSRPVTSVSDTGNSHFTYNDKKSTTTSISRESNCSSSSSNSSKRSNGGVVTPMDKHNWLNRRSFRFWRSKADVNKSNQKQRSKSSSPPHLSVYKAPPPCIDSLSVPPADFDWEASGMTNPLKGQGSASSQSSAILDVDFFTANGVVGGVSSASTLQRDLDAFGLSATDASKDPPKTKPPTNVLDTLLSSQKSSSRQHKQPSELSLDARALHDQLPDISYLKASMIMFPIGQRDRE